MAGKATSNSSETSLPVRMSIHRRRVRRTVSRIRPTQYQPLCATARDHGFVEPSSVTSTGRQSAGNICYKVSRNRCRTRPIGPVSPVGAVVGLGGALDISAGNDHTCALIDDRHVKCWDGVHGQLGNDGFSNKAEAVFVRDVTLPTGDAEFPHAVLSDVVKISSGGYSSCVLKANGAMKCWGNNTKEELAGFTPSPSWSNAVPIRDEGYELSGVNRDRGRCVSCLRNDKCRPGLLGQKRLSTAG